MESGNQPVSPASRGGRLPPLFPAARIAAIAALAAAIGLLGGCGDSKLEGRKAKEFREGAWHLQNVVDAREIARERIYEIEAQRAVERFRLEHQRNPDDLEELEEESNPPLKRLPPPRHYVYDPDTGTITVE